MKIVCESCAAKYSIADEKVAGKVFKIRCKRCSEVIVVRGDQSAEPQDDAGTTGADAIWHVVVDGDQQGPLSVAQLSEMLSSAAIDWEAFVWTEGFENWVALREVDDLVSQISGGGEEPATAQQTTTAAGGFGAAAPEAFADEASMGADPFAEAAAPAAPSDAYGQSGPLTGGGAAAASPSPEPSPRVSEEQAMTGARNENSVLFSLKNLQALATGSTTPSVSPGGAPSSRPSPGFASGEGSGLIDIRALASATGTGAAAARPGNDEKDELLSLGGQAGGLGALASPMMAPASNEGDNNNKLIAFAVILGGAVLLAAGVVAFAVVNRSEPQPTAAVAPVAPVAPLPTAPAAGGPAPAAAAAAATGVAPAATPPPAAPPPSEGELAAQKAAEEAKSAPDSDDAASKARSERRKQRRARATASNERASQPVAKTSKPKPAPSRPKARGGSSSIDQLLEGALAGGGKKPSRSTSKSAPASNLPEKPSRDDVVNAMNKVKSAVSACSKGGGGVAFANITVKGASGRVTNATIQGQTGATGSCIARAVRKARFPKFKAATFKVKFPFRL